jgi:hypothetical protein
MFDLSGKFVDQQNSNLNYLKSNIEKNFRLLESNFNQTTLQNVEYFISQIFNSEIKQKYLERLKEFR